jgi:hypothetical protein
VLQDEGDEEEGNDVGWDTGGDGEGYGDEQAAWPWPGQAQGLAAHVADSSGSEGGRDDLGHGVEAGAGQK